MKQLYFFEDVDGISVDVEQDLNDCFDSLRVIKILYDYGCNCSFPAYVINQLGVSLDSCIDLVNGLLLGFHSLPCCETD